MYCCVKILSLSVLMEIKKYSQAIDTIMAEKEEDFFLQFKNHIIDAKHEIL